MNEPAKPQPAIRVVMMPRDTNPMGTVFGGIILSFILKAAVEGSSAGTLDSLSEPFP